jgi:hypothetical protein
MQTIFGEILSRGETWVYYNRISDISSDILASLIG